MPQTRTKAEYEEKAAEILEAAISRLTGGGLEALSIAALARELGLAQNTIYWYYPSRDHLLVAAMGKMAERIINAGSSPATMADAAAKPVTTKETILLAVDRFAKIHPIRIALRDRRQSSPVLQEFDARLRDFLHEALGQAFSPFVPASDMEMAIETFMTASDGCYARGLGPAERRAVMGFVLDRLGVTD